MDIMTLADHAAHLYTCTESQKNGKPCSNKAFYHLPSNPAMHFCKRHAAQYCETHSFLCADDAQFATKTKRKLIALCESGASPRIPRIPHPKHTDKKDVWVQHAQTQFKDRILPWIGTEGRGSEEVNIIQIGRNIKTFFDAHPATPLISTVLIENQISPHMTGGTKRLMGASRMKMIQVILMQYFLVRGNDPLHVEFVASSHKLNQFRPSPLGLPVWTQCLPPAWRQSVMALSHGLKDGPLYRAHKKQAKQICNYLLSDAFQPREDPEWRQWQSRHASHPKKDDLDDSFLQGLSYICKNMPGPV